ncbi:unnamed protein product [Rhizopus stolonifer]
MESSVEAATTDNTPIIGKMKHVKLVLLGDSAYADNSEPTIGAAFSTQKLILKDRSIKFEIWDTAGQERFHSLAPMYYRNSQAAIVVYDITKIETLDKAKSWIKELQRQANTDIVIALVGNKLDLVEGENGEALDDDDERHVLREDAQAYAEEAGLLFFETSAKSSYNVDNVFCEIGKKIPLDNMTLSNNRNTAGGRNNLTNGINLQQPLNSGNSGCAC